MVIFYQRLTGILSTNPSLICDWFLSSAAIGFVSVSLTQGWSQCNGGKMAWFLSLAGSHLAVYCGLLCTLPSGVSCIWTETSNPSEINFPFPNFEHHVLCLKKREATKTNIYTVSLAKTCFWNYDSLGKVRKYFRRVFSNICMHQSEND